MTKEDYMRLPKERLSELLVEKETQRVAYMPIHLCYEQGGTCTNPFHDCVNCPKAFGSWSNYTGQLTTNTTNTERNDNE